MKGILAKLNGDAFLKNNLIFFVGSLVVAALNYLYHPILARFLGVEEFGEVQVLISFTYITGIFLVVLKTIVTNLESHADGDDGDISGLYSQLYTVSLVFVVVFAIVLTLASSFLSELFQFQGTLSFVSLGIIVLCSVPFVFYGALLQGQKKFGALSVANILFAGGKIVFAVLLVLLGWGVFGALFALAISSLLGFWFMRKRISTSQHVHLAWPIRITEGIRREFSYGMLVLWALGFVTFFYTADVIVVKYLFSPEEAGLYSGIATIGRIIFFATASVSAVVLPSVVRTKSFSENFAVLKKALFLIGSMGSVVLGFFFLFPEMIVRILMGGGYLRYASLLPIVGLYIFGVSVLNLVFMYFLALRDRRIVMMALLGLGALSISLYLYHQTIFEVVTSFLFSVVSVLLVVIGQFLFCEEVREIHEA